MSVIESWIEELDKTNGYLPHVWLKKLNDPNISNESLAEQISSDLKFVYDLGVQAGRRKEPGFNV